MTVQQERPDGEEAAPEDVDWWNQIVALHAVVERDVAAVLRRRGVSVSEYRALALLAAAPEYELRILDLADALNLNQSSVSRLVGRLESAELVRRETCGDDRRGVFTVLTETGTSVLNGLDPAYRQALSAAIAHAGEKSAVIAAITQAVRQVHGSQDRNGD